MAAPARAADCPPTFDTEPCGGVCSWSSNTWTCDVSTASIAGNVVMVADYATDHDYEAWGDIDGTTFCCAIDCDNNTPITKFVIQGSDATDQLSFTWDSLTYNLMPLTGRTVTAEIWGDDGDDTIRGSHYASGDYSEFLYGEGGADTMFGNGGDDYMSGGPGDDTMLGGDGNDEMYGGDGNDEMLGGRGDDEMHGDAGDDTMRGDAGNDEMWGGPGNDAMSGGPGDDEMYGDQGGDCLCGDGEIAGDWLQDDNDPTDTNIDYLWGAISVDTVNCVTPGTTMWDGNSINYSGSCDTAPAYILTDRPDCCP